MRLVDTGAALTSYRYLRLSLIGLVTFIGLAVIIERLSTDKHCFQPSISDYYYTPAQAVFVGSLMAIGICLIALKGSSGGEDVLLNLAGMMAPVVALVPTLAGDPGSQCSSVLVNAGNTGQNVQNVQNVQNNILALLIVTAVVLLAIGFDMIRNRAAKDDRDRLGLFIAVLVVASFWLWFGFGFDLFLARAHYVAAILLFVFIWCVVLLNAEGPVGGEPAGPRGAKLLAETRRWLFVFVQTIFPVRTRWRNRYGLIAFLMFWSVVVMSLFLLLAKWKLGLLWIEATQILLFALFWTLQTKEKWTAEKWSAKKWNEQASPGLKR